MDKLIFLEIYRQVTHDREICSQFQHLHIKFDRYLDCPFWIAPRADLFVKLKANTGFLLSNFASLYDASKKMKTAGTVLKIHRYFLVGKTILIFTY